MLSLVIEVPAWERPKDINGQDIEPTPKSKKRELQFRSDALLQDVCNKIAEIWEIPIDYQELYYKDDQLIGFNSTLSSHDISGGDTIVFNHMFVKKWERAYRDYKQKKLSGSDATDLASTTLERIKQLEASKFFALYDDIDIIAIKADCKEYFAGYLPAMQKIAQDFFLNLHPNALKIEFKTKEDGMQVGIVCHITDQQGTTLYYVKSNQQGPKIYSSRSACRPNLEEIFLYSFFQSVGIAPECFFILPPKKSFKGTIYIGTKGIENFNETRMDKLNSSTKNISKILIEIHVLMTIFRIGDMSDTNTGHFNHELCIVDFSIPLTTDYKIYQETENKPIITMQDFFENYLRGPSCTLDNGIKNWDLHKAYENITVKDKYLVAKEALSRWNLMENIEKAEARALDVKNRMKELQIIYEGTNELEKYVQDVQANYHAFSKLMNKFFEEN